MSATAAETNSTKAVDAAMPATAAVAHSSDSVPLESIRRSTEATSSAQNVAPADGPPADAVDAVELAGQHSTASEPTESSAAAPRVLANSEDAIEEGPKPPTKEADEADEADMAIGDAQEHIGSASTAEPGAPPVCNITLLLTSGSRHPYKIDAKYLARRNVDIPDETEHGHPDPFSISIYTLKELILREWRSDWEAKPASPSSIRLIHFGKLLDDKEQLKSMSCFTSPYIKRISANPRISLEYQFSSEAPNVVHMSVRPQDLDEEEAKPGGKSLGAGAGDGQRSRSGGSCCVIL